MIVQKYTFLANLQKVYSLVFVRHNKMKLYVQVSGFLRDAFGFLKTETRPRSRFLSGALVKVWSVNLLLENFLCLAVCDKDVYSAWNVERVDVELASCNNLSGSVV